MGLTIPEEPNDIKEMVRGIRRRLGEYDNINYDALAVWSFNRLPKYLWTCWKDDLKVRGITWQKFLKILKLHTLDIVEWALRDTMSWEEFVNKIEKSIENYSSLRGVK